MEISEQLQGGLVVTYRPNVKGPSSHDSFTEPLVLSRQFYLFQMRDHRPSSTWEGAQQESTVTICSVTSLIYAEAVTDMAQETGTLKDFHTAGLILKPVMRLR